MYWEGYLKELAEEETKKVGGSFGGDFFKHFYQEQGDYSQAEKIEEEEEKKAKDAKKKKSSGKKSQKQKS